MTTYIPQLTLPQAVFDNPAFAILLPIVAGAAVGYGTRREPPPPFLPPPQLADQPAVPKQPRRRRLISPSSSRPCAPRRLSSARYGHYCTA